jgi:hypothetical protein
MTYKYYIAGKPSIPTSASSAWVNDFQESLNYQFDNATTVFSDILEESVFASGSYVQLQARVVSGINPETQTKQGDDFKKILFKDISHPISPGMKYMFSNNVWITINCENIKSLTASATVRRANNQLRWMSGSTVLTEVCCLEYDLKNPRFDVPQSNLVVPQAYTRIYAQQNAKTNTIKSNQRFLFGNTNNWQSYRVLEVRNYLNQQTLNDNTSQLLVLEVQKYQGNEDTDDLVNGIANYYDYIQSGSSTAVSSIVVSPNDGSILEGNSQVFDVRYYSGSTIVSGSFVFSIYDSNVPVDHYSFSTLTNNTFSVTNNEMFTDYPLIVLCSGTSGSRTFDVSLQGAW